MAVIIEARNISKVYKLGVARAQDDNFRELLLQLCRKSFQLLNPRVGSPAPAKRVEDFWALKDVSFDVEEGDVLGVIGRNGAGKSTLLKILSRITEPTKGLIKIRGRLSSLLEVGTGFHPELTGRENIFMNGAILGMRRAEIASNFDAIVAFAEIERFLNTPVKRYSSGMYVRLAFAVAAHLNPEILVVDEVLAVGDLAFQKKCLGKMSEVSQGGRTVLFVSHNMAAVESLCKSGMVLEQGNLTFAGNIKEAIEYYMKGMAEISKKQDSHIIDLSNSPTRSPKYQPLLKRLELSTSEGKPLNGGIPIGAPLKVKVSFQLDRPTLNYDVILGFDSFLGQRIFTASTNYEPARSLESRVGEQTIICEIPCLNILPGEYKIRAVLTIGNAPVDIVDDAAHFTINPSDFYGTGKVPQMGVVALPQQWKSV